MQAYPNYSPTNTAEQPDVLQEPEVTYMAQQSSNSAPGYVDAMNDWAFASFRGKRSDENRPKGAQ